MRRPALYQQHLGQQDHSPGGGFTRAAAVLAVILLVVAACGGNEDTGDVEAFCDLVETGVGVSSAAKPLEASEFDLLAEVAPPDVLGAVRTLGNSTRDLSELASAASLQELFKAAFDPSAVQAQENFVEYITGACTVDLAALQAGPGGSDQDLLADLRVYVDQRFSSQPWVDKVRFDLQNRGLRGDSIEVSFVIAPAEGEPIDACESVSVYLYDVAGELGSVAVMDGKDTVAQRTGPDSTCKVR